MRYIQVGVGYRFRLVPKVLADLPGWECCGVIASRSRVRTRRMDHNSLELEGTVGRYLKERKPDLVVCLTPTRLTARVLRVCAEVGTPVLGHPPLVDELAGELTRIHIGMYTLFTPSNLARLRVVERGDIGDVTQVQISGTPIFSAVALMRKFLGTGLDDGRASAHRFQRITLGSLDFGEDRMGIFQPGSQSSRGTPARLLVKGSAGEISGDQVVQRGGLIRISYLRRSQVLTSGTGALPLTQQLPYLCEISYGGTTLWMNPFPQMEWSEKELGIAQYLSHLEVHLRGEGPSPYSLIEAAHDARLIQGLVQAIREAGDSHGYPGTELHL